MPTRKGSRDEITCKVTESTVVVMESSNDAAEMGAGTCMISGVTLSSSAALINIFENPSDPEFDRSKPVSDRMEIDPSGTIVLLSDFGGMGLPARGGPSSNPPILDVTEPGGFDPVVFTIDRTTYKVFSDVAPEPSTLLLFGSGLFALFARRKGR